MKRLLLILLSAMALWSCNKEAETAARLVSFTDTGCGRETKATVDGPSQLILEYSPQGLVVTHLNALLNCSINNGGIACEVSVVGNAIHLKAYERSGDFLKCMCPVERMSSTISGLRLNTEYVLEYTCGHDYYPIDFRYEKGLKKIIDLDTFMR